jgi:hypothetical protein
MALVCLCAITPNLKSCLDHTHIKNPSLANSLVVVVVVYPLYQYPSPSLPLPHIHRDTHNPRTLRPAIDRLVSCSHPPTPHPHSTSTTATVGSFHFRALPPPDFFPSELVAAPPVCGLSGLGLGDKMEGVRDRGRGWA